MGDDGVGCIWAHADGFFDLAAEFRKNFRVTDKKAARIVSLECTGLILFKFASNLKVLIVLHSPCEAAGGCVSSREQYIQTLISQCFWIPRLLDKRIDERVR